MAPKDVFELVCAVVGVVVFYFANQAAMAEKLTKATGEITASLFKMQTELTEKLHGIDTRLAKIEARSK